MHDGPVISPFSLHGVPLRIVTAPHRRRMTQVPPTSAPTELVFLFLNDSVDSLGPASMVWLSGVVLLSRQVFISPPIEYDEYMTRR